MLLMILTTSRRIVMAYSTSSTQHKLPIALLLGLGLLPLLSTLLLLPVPSAEGVSNCNSKGCDQNSKGAPGGGDPCPCPFVDPRMHPTHEVYYGQNVVWQIPPHPKAVLYIATAATQTPFYFFDRGPKCRPCFGRPEDRAFALEALKWGYAVIVVQSLADAFVAWPLEDSEDLVIVVKVIKEWTKKHSLENLPLTTFGHSAGGNFAMSLSMRLPVQAQVLMACSGQRELVEDADLGRQIPSTFFVYMPSDRDTLGVSTRVERAMSILQKRGVEVAAKQTWPKPVYPLYFTERIPCMSNETSEKLFMAYKAEGWVARNGSVIRNSAVEDWEAPLLKWKPLAAYPDSGDCHVGFFVEQQLRLAEGSHTFTNDGDEEVFSWLDSQLFLRDHSSTPLSAIG